MDIAHPPESERAKLSPNTERTVLPEIIKFV